MTIMHHPSDIVLAEFANATLDEAAALVVGAHIERCGVCQQSVRQLEVVGGAMIEDAGTDARLQVDADAILARLDGNQPSPKVPSVETGNVTAGLTPGDILSHYESGQWRWIGRGVYWRKISVPSNADIRVFMLKAKGGTSLPHHKHSGMEWTQVLEGAFRHDHGRYGPGDFDEADSSVEHDPIVEEGSDCICLVAMNGKLELQGLIGRVLQPFVRL